MFGCVVYVVECDGVGFFVVVVIFGCDLDGDFFVFICVFWVFVC